MNETMILANQNAGHEVLRRQVLVIETSVFTKPGELDSLRNRIIEQMKDGGVVVLPNFCKAKVVDADAAMSFIGLCRTEDDLK